MSRVIFCLNYSPGLSDGELHSEHRRLCSAHYDPLLEPQPPQPSRSASRTLKLGYLSPDFCRHPVARFLLPVLAHHNREQFEVKPKTQTAYDPAAPPLFTA